MKRKGRRGHRPHLHARRFKQNRRWRRVPFYALAPKRRKRADPAV